jgi:hypothetical protein
VVNHGQSDETQGLKISLKSPPGVRVPQITLRDRQHVLGGVKHRKWLHRLPQNTKLRKGALLNSIHMVLVLISPRVGAAVLVTGIGGCIEPEKLQARLVVHICARYTTQGLWPHGTTTHVSKFAKAADACSTLWRAKETWESYTELFAVDTEGGKLFSVLVYSCSYNRVYVYSKLTAQKL